MISGVSSFFRRRFHGVAVAAALVCAQVITTPLHADFLTSFGSGGNQFNMVFVPIGNAGNSADTTGFGGVSYQYNLSKYEVSRDMIGKANSDGGLGITLSNMGSMGGNGANRPATGITWNEAARFVNWLNTSQGYSAAYKFSTQPGQPGYNLNENIQLWLPTDAGYNAANLFRNSQARYFLPSVDEWYKAAYYDSTANGGLGGYWNHALGSDSAPTQVTGGTVSNTAVYGQSFGQGPADIDNAGGLGPNGVMALAGNVYEWEESNFYGTSDPSSNRGARGGWWASSAIDLDASSRANAGADYDAFNVGFRVASVPEPGSAAILMLLSTSALWQRRRRSS